MYPENPYFLLTPGPLSTSKTVKAAMLHDWCTWDEDYKELVQQIRSDLLSLVGLDAQYTTILMQGSGTFCIESVLTSTTTINSKLLVLENGAYGNRMAQIAECIGTNFSTYKVTENQLHDLEVLEKLLVEDRQITHVSLVHCETTTGLLNPAEKIAKIAKKHDKVFILDAMSSFGGIPIDIASVDIDFVVSSANKCIQGVPGFGFVLAKRNELEKCKGLAGSLSLDLFDQWQVMEKDLGKWRFTSPTHTVRAFVQALKELFEEGGVKKRHERYQENHRILVQGMREAGFETFLPDHLQSPIITAFHNPTEAAYNFKQFYQLLKAKGFVIYPGKVSEADTFRIGNIGHIFPKDMQQLIEAIKASLYWKSPKAVS